MKLIDFQKQYRRLKKYLNPAVIKTLEVGRFILDKNVKTLEKRIARLTGNRFALGLNSGTDALFLSLKALDIGPGDEVITTPFSFIATAEVIANCGAKPVFVDIDPETFNIDASKIEKAVTKKTKAIIPVHLYGQMANMEKITKIARKHKLWVIEDAAQALGAKQKVRGIWRTAGSIGDVGCFSFFPTKNLGAYGDAGMVVTNSKKIADRIRLLRNHGATKKYFHEILGYSSRLDELQATILMVKINFFKRWNETRRRLATIYTKELNSMPQIKTPPTLKNNYHVFHQYTIRAKQRDKLKSHLQKRGVPTAIHYPLPLHLQPALKYLGYKKGDFPITEKTTKEVLSLPIYPGLTLKEQKMIIGEIKKFFKSK